MWSETLWVYSVLMHPCTAKCSLSIKESGGPKHGDERVRNANMRGRQLHPTKQVVSPKFEQGNGGEGHQQKA